MGIASLFRRKSLSQLIEEAGDPNIEHGHGLKRQLNALSLTMLGVGGVIGAGIFTITGQAAANHAGPGIVFSFLIGAVLCALAGLCYAELSAMIPIAGSAYAYTYATMGELIAWIIGWDLCLEYAVGATTVAVGWSGYLHSLLTETLHVPMPDVVHQLFKCPWDEITLPDGRRLPGIFNVPATLITVAASAILYRGIREAGWVNTAIVVLKVTVIVVFIAVGIGVVSSDLLFVNPSATGVLSMVPEREVIAATADVAASSRYGWGLGGVMTGASVVFFAYIGFDAVSTAAQETKNPARDLPIGILGTLVVCTLLYVLVAMVLTGVVPYRELAVDAPIALGIDRIVELRGWSPSAELALTLAVKTAAIAGLTSVIIVLLYGQTRVFYAVAKDGLLPWFDATHARFHTPHVATIITGAVTCLLAGSLPMNKLAELTSIGTLLAFLLVCLGVPILRSMQPDVPRPFKLRLPYVIGPVGALACLAVMVTLPADTWFRLLAWLVVGFVIYFAYGRKHARTAKIPIDAPLDM